MHLLDHAVMMVGAVVRLVIVPTRVVVHAVLLPGHDVLYRTGGWSGMGLPAAPVRCLARRSESYGVQVTGFSGERRI